MISAISIALSGLQAAVKKVNATADNIANVSSVGSLSDAKNPPYTPVTAQNSAITDQNGNGVGVRSDIVAKQDPFYPSYQPDSPFADQNGIVGAPNVDLAEEAVNLKIAEVTYKANLATIKASEDMFNSLFQAIDKKA